MIRLPVPLAGQRGQPERPLRRAFAYIRAVCATSPPQRRRIHADTTRYGADVVKVRLIKTVAQNRSAGWKRGGTRMGIGSAYEAHRKQSSSS